MVSIDKIRQCKNDEELTKLTKKLIKKALKESKENNPYKGLIGTKTDINQKEFDFFTPMENRIMFSVDIWNGYIPLGTKIVYGTIYNFFNKTISSGGYYYYVDDDSYVYDFIKFIKDYEIEDEYDAVAAVNDFSQKLLSKTFNCKKRSDIHGLLLNKYDKFFDPSKEHSVKDFYGNGSAQCTEYALVANNLLSVLEIPVSFFNDKKHAYNVMFVPVDDEKYDSYILDYSDCVFVYDEHLNCVERFPFFKKIEGGTKEYIEEVVNNGKRIYIEDFELLRINDRYFECSLGKDRDYGVEHEPLEEKKLIIKR